METTYHIIKAEGTEETVTVDLPRDPGYRALRDIVVPALQGADMERVRVLHNGSYTDMFVDDSGLLKGLRRNKKATDLYRANWLANHPGADPEDLPAIAGTAILFTRPVWF